MAPQKVFWRKVQKKYRAPKKYLPAAKKKSRQLPVASEHVCVAHKREIRVLAPAHVLDPLVQHAHGFHHGRARVNDGRAVKFDKHVQQVCRRAVKQLVRAFANAALETGEIRRQAASQLLEKALGFHVESFLQQHALLLRAPFEEQAQDRAQVAARHKARRVTLVPVDERVGAQLLDVRPVEIENQDAESATEPEMFPVHHVVDIGDCVVQLHEDVVQVQVIVHKLAQFHGAQRGGDLEHHARVVLNGHVIFEPLVQSHHAPVLRQQHAEFELFGFYFPLLDVRALFACDLVVDRRAHGPFAALVRTSHVIQRPAELFGRDAVGFHQAQHVCERALFSRGQIAHEIGTHARLHQAPHHVAVNPQLVLQAVCFAHVWPRVGHKHFQPRARNRQAFVADHARLQSQAPNVGRRRGVGLAPFQFGDALAHVANVDVCIELAVALFLTHFFFESKTHIKNLSRNTSVF